MPRVLCKNDTNFPHQHPYKCYLVTRDRNFIDVYCVACIKRYCANYQFGPGIQFHTISEQVLTPTEIDAHLEHHFALQ